MQFVIENRVKQHIRVTYLESGEIVKTEYSFTGLWVEFDREEIPSLCNFLYLVIESDNVCVGFSDDSYKVVSDEY